jgi:hypothetical protein
MLGSAHTERQAAQLRTLAERLGLPPLRQLIKTPGLSAVLRLTVYYDARDSLDSVGTLRHSRAEGTQLTMAYWGAFHNQPLRYPIAEERYEALTQALSRIRFDHLPDQPTLPPYGVDLWMLERAAGSFIHGVILAPASAQADHAMLVSLVREHLPEALRLIPGDQP